MVTEKRHDLQAIINEILPKSSKPSDAQTEWCLIDITWNKDKEANRHAGYIVKLLTDWPTNGRTRPDKEFRWAHNYKDMKKKRKSLKWCLKKRWKTFKMASEKMASRTDLLSFIHCLIFRADWEIRLSDETRKCHTSKDIINIQNLRRLCGLLWLLTPRPLNFLSTHLIILANKCLP